MANLFQGLVFSCGVFVGAVALIVVALYISIAVVSTIDDGVDKLKRKLSRKYS